MVFQRVYKDSDLGTCTRGPWHLLRNTAKRGLASQGSEGLGSPFKPIGASRVCFWSYWERNPPLVQAPLRYMD